MWWTILWFSDLFVWFSLFGNALSIAVLTRSKFRAYLGSYILTGLSVANLFFLMITGPVYMYITIAQIFPSMATSKIQHILLYSHPIASMFQYAATWLTVIATIEKYIEICHPFTYERYFTKQIVIGVVVVNFLTAVAYNFIRFWEYDHDEKGKITVLLRKDDLYVVYRDIISVFVQAIIPFVVIITLNILILQRIKELTYCGRQLSDSEAQEHEHAKIVRYIGLTFFVCYSYPCVLNIIEIFDPDFFTRPYAGLLLNIYSLITMINALAVFFFFVLFSKMFRQELSVVLQCACFARLHEKMNLPSSTKSSFHRQSIDTPVSFAPEDLARQATVEPHI